MQKNDFFFDGKEEIKCKCGINYKEVQNFSKNPNFASFLPLKGSDEALNFGFYKTRKKKLFVFLW